MPATLENTEFERGAIWALELLKKQVLARTRAYRGQDVDQDLNQIINASSNLAYGVLAEFEKEFVKTIKAAQDGKAQATDDYSVLKNMLIERGVSFTVNERTPYSKSKSRAEPSKLVKIDGYKTINLFENCRDEIEFKFTTEGVLQDVYHNGF